MTLPCRYVIARRFNGGAVWCCQPGKRASGSVFCYEHFPAVCS